VTKSAVFMPHGNVTKGGRALLVGLLAASSLVAMSTISGEATASTPHVSSTCVQEAAFPYGSAVAGIAETRGGGGYWIVANDGHIAACGDAPFLGQQTTLNAPIVGIAATPDGGGYYLVGSDGGIFTFGDAEFQGSPSAIQLNTPVIGMAVDTTTGGYWLVATDGGIFAYNAPFLGSTGSMTLNRPVTGMAAASDGTGYWLVATDGGVFAYGVPFLGSTGSIPLNKPVVGMASDAESRGYWLVASDGGIFSYRAPFYGSTGSVVLNGPIAGMEAATGGSGYRFIGSDGGVFTYGSLGFYGTPVFAPPPQAQVTAVGDSIMVDYQDPLKIDIPGVTVDAAVGRQWSTGESILRGIRDRGQLGRRVIVGLGTNGPITDADFDTMMSILGGASRVVFVSVHVDRSWQDSNNAVLVNGAVRYPKAVIADWATLASQNPQWFGVDGTHLAVDGPGAVALASLVATTLSER
jgi:hypothetical protein